MRFLINPECYHKMCESCVERIFSHGPAPCPIAGCNRTLRRNRFRTQTFGDIQVEKEVDVRKRVAKTFNRRQEDFETLLDYNNYLEEVENITFNLLNGIDLDATEKKMKSYASANAADIATNITLDSEERGSVEARAAAQKAEARIRREQAREEELRERKEKVEGKNNIIDQLATTKGNAGQIIHQQKKVLLQKSSARRKETEGLSRPSQSLGGSFLSGGGLKNDDAAADGGFMIKGLKKKVVAEPEKPYDPFGGLSDTRQYYKFHGNYEHP
jgi:CDK-activating kinase assembly factor MAT1